MTRYVLITMLYTVYVYVREKEKEKPMKNNGEIVRVCYEGERYISYTTHSRAVSQRERRLTALIHFPAFLIWFPIVFWSYVVGCRYTEKNTMHKSICTKNMFSNT